MNKNKIAIIVLAALLLITGGFLYKTLDEMKNIKNQTTGEMKKYIILLILVTTLIFSASQT